MSCDAELCPYWTGQGCACAVLDLDKPAARCADPYCDGDAGHDGRHYQWVPE